MCVRARMCIEREKRAPTQPKREKERMYGWLAVSLGIMTVSRGAFVLEVLSSSSLANSG